MSVPDDRFYLVYEGQFGDSADLIRIDLERCCIQPTRHTTVLRTKRHDAIDIIGTDGNIGKLNLRSPDFRTAFCRTWGETSKDIIAPGDTGSIVLVFVAKDLEGDIDRVLSACASAGSA